LNIKLLSALLLFVFIHVKFSWAGEEMTKNESFLLVDDNKSNRHNNSMAAEELFDILCKEDTILNLDEFGIASLNPQDLLEFFPNPLDSMFLSQNEFSCNDIGGIIEVTVTVIDSTGSEDQCTSNVEIVDNINPLIICPENISITAMLDSCMAFVDILPATIADNCDVANIINDYNGTADPSDMYPTGVNIVTITVTDESGNIAACDFSVTVVDSLIVDCNPGIVQNNESGLCQAFVSVPPPTVVTCSEDSISITNNIFEGDNASGIYAVGNTNVIWTIIGESVAIVCEQSIVIIDDEAPTVICKDFMLELNDQGQGTITAFDVIENFNDNCGVFAFDLDKSEFDINDLGENIVAVSIMDGAGNTAGCISTITVLGIEPPTAICNNISIILDESGNAEIDVAEVGDGSFSDNGIASMVSSPGALSCSDIGETLITLTVTDVFGLSSTCTAEITLLDTIAPVVHCKDASMTKHDYWDETYAINAIDNGISDNCFISGYTLVRNSSSVKSHATIKLVAYDISGNKTSCIANVNILEEECNTRFTVYPNPSNGIFKLSNFGIDGEYKFEMINNLGEIVYSKNLKLFENESKTINPFKIGAGVYMIKLTNINKQCHYTSKIVIQ
jgi:hypothetical protein